MFSEALETYFIGKQIGNKWNTFALVKRQFTDFFWTT